MVVIGIAVGAAAGAGIAWARGMRRTAEVREQLAAEQARAASVDAGWREQLAAEQARATATDAGWRQQLEQAQAQWANERTALQTEQARREQLLKEAHAESEQRLRASQEELRSQFKALAADVLKESSSSFLTVANERFQRAQKESTGELEKREQLFRSLVEPMKETLAKVEEQTTKAEKERAVTYAALGQQIKQMLDRSEELGRTTESLRSALRRPEIRGRWGELHLRRVVEVAGLVNGVDFEEQQSDTDAAGKRLRPDMIVTLWGGRRIVVDAKTPLDAILDIDSDPENAEEHAKQHALNVRKRVKELSSKDYRSQFNSELDFSVLFLPAESFLQVATEQDPHLLTDAYNAGVIIATPTVLVAMLRTVAHSWRVESLAKNAQDVLSTGKELYKRLSTMSKHLVSLGKSIDKAAQEYNSTVGSLERQVLPQARRFAALQEITTDIELEPAKTTVREVAAPELIDQGAAAELEEA